MGVTRVLLLCWWRLQAVPTGPLLLACTVRSGVQRPAPQCFDCEEALRRLAAAYTSALSQSVLLLPLVPLATAQHTRASRRTGCCRLLVPFRTC